MLKGGLLIITVGVVFVLAGFWAGFSLSHASGGPGTALGAEAAAAAASPMPPRNFDGLQASVVQLLQAGGARGGVTLVELDGPNPQSWSYNGSQTFTAASTYKLPLLMQEAQNVASGRWRSTDRLCFQSADYEDGWYTDYDTGTCMNRVQLDRRVGQSSDNTAAHILVRVAGGATVLRRYATSHGARQSVFYDPNTTTSGDLARLWAEEATGKAGGRAAQQYLYPMLTRTTYEKGIPAGVPGTATVVHKIGILDGIVNDAALVTNGPHGSYVLTICTVGRGGDAGWKVLADISRAVWQFEAAR